MKRKYRSKLEAEVAKKIPEFEYESVRMEYWQLKTYTPDFIKGKTYVEVKGFFRPGDQAKYIAIKEQCEEYGIEFVFLFADPNKKVRKNAKMTMAQWCDKYGIPWFSLKDIKKLKEYIQK